MQDTWTKLQWLVLTDVTYRAHVDQRNLHATPQNTFLASLEDLWLPDAHLQLITGS